MPLWRVVAFAAAGVLETVLGIVLFVRVHQRGMWALNVFNTCLVWQPALAGHACFDRVPGTAGPNACVVAPSLPRATGFDPSVVTATALLLAGVLHLLYAYFLYRHRATGQPVPQRDATNAVYGHTLAAQAMLVPVPLVLVGVSDAYALVAASLLHACGDLLTLTREHVAMWDADAGRYQPKAAADRSHWAFGLNCNLLGLIAQLAVWSAVLDKLHNAHRAGHPPDDITHLVVALFTCWALAAATQALQLWRWLRPTQAPLPWELAELAILVTGLTARLAAFAIMHSGSLATNHDHVQNRLLVSTAA